MRKLVGDEFFAAMAGVFLRAHPPRSRMLMLYGDGLPAFLAEFPPVAQLGYLPDVARLEQAMRESYHAADSAPLPEAEFQRLIGAGYRGTAAAAGAVVAAGAVALAGGVDLGGQPRGRPRAQSRRRGCADPAARSSTPARTACPRAAAAFLHGLLQGATVGRGRRAGRPGAGPARRLGLLVQGRAITGVSA